MAKLRPNRLSERPPLEIAQKQPDEIIAALDARGADAQAVKYLRDCGREIPCGRQLCPKCQRLLSRGFCEAFVHLGLENDHWTAIEVVTAGGRALGGALDTINIGRQVEKARRRVKRSLPARVLIGGASARWHAAEWCWRTHLELVVLAPNNAALGNAISKVFDVDSRPGVNISLEDVATGTFLDRLSRVVRGNGVGLSGPVGAERSLPKPQRLEIDDFRLRRRLDSLLILNGLRWSPSKSGGMRFKLDRSVI